MTNSSNIILLPEAHKVQYLHTFKSQVLCYCQANATVGAGHYHHFPLDSVLTAALHWPVQSGGMGMYQ